MTDVQVQLIVQGVVNSIGIMALVYYSVHRKFKDDNPKTRTWKMWIDRWRVELIIGAVLVPQWADWFPAVVNRFLPGA